MSLHIFANNLTNKYGYRFPTENLISSGLNAKWKTGTPSFISHDYHRLLGWAFPIGAQISPIAVSLMGHLRFVDEANKVEMISCAKQYLKKELGTFTDEEKKKLSDKLNGKLSSKAMYWRNECLSVLDKSIAIKIAPELFPSPNDSKRNLVDLHKLKIIGPGVFDYEGIALFAHSYFRRSASHFNSLNEFFLSELQSQASNENVTVKIALDPDCVGLAETYSFVSELEYWRGPKFQNDIVNIQSGVTEHQANELQQEFSGISRMEFFWYKNEEQQNFECEEVRDIPSNGISEESFACRYVHSIIDLDKKQLHHADGAVRIYDEAGIVTRWDKDISKSGKQTAYHKLWRVDGKISVANWKSLVSNFYWGNELPQEYFTAEKAIPELDTKPLKKEISTEECAPKVLPIWGPQLFVAYYEKINTENEIQLFESAVLQNNDKTYRCIEADSFEYLKNIRKKFQLPINMIAEFTVLDYGDGNINIPPLIFNVPSAGQNATVAFKEFTDFCSLKHSQHGEQSVTACFGITYCDCTVLFSIANHTSNTLALPDFPSSFDHIASWCEKVATLLNQQYHDATLTKKAYELITSKGLYLIPRTSVADWEIVKANNLFELKIPQKDKELMNLFAKGEFSLGIVTKINSWKCNCGNDYSLCNCSTLTTPNCNIEVLDAELIDKILMKTDCEKVNEL